ncbi:hypothetical protein JKP88DRAFT_186941 [Tribonema minus]|uniref:Uncharacterized protein n=1 Tax=Tribonema minus TaxID=303371 RepID=A0A835Z281_9STRA|nr:hypothetical protein JKP88DRAFT_186941 [Tribonema minus]
MAFFKGLQHRTPRMRRAAAGNSAGGSAHGRRAAAESVGGGIGYEDSGKDWAHSLVLATGSADGNIYTFDMSKGEGGDLQTLRGHNDRVYAVHFHPTEPRLVSGSADQTVRIWGPSKGGRRNGRK